MTYNVESRLKRPLKRHKLNPTKTHSYIALWRYCFLFLFKFDKLILRVRLALLLQMELRYQIEWQTSWLWRI